MVFVELGLARAMAFSFIRGSFCVSRYSVFKALATLSFFLIQIATPFSTKNSAFYSSCPGIGLIIIIGKCEVKLSVEVSPPGLVMTKEEIDINSGT